MVSYSGFYITDAYQYLVLLSEPHQQLAKRNTVFPVLLSAMPL